MTRKYSSWILLILLFPLLLGGADKSKKAYELIYQDIQLIKQQLLSLDKKIERNQEDIKAVRKSTEELLTTISLILSEQVSLREEQKKIPAQFQILLEKIDALSLQISKFTEELIEIKRASLVSQQEEEPPDQEAPPPDEQIPPPAEEPGEETKEDLPAEEPAPVLDPNLSPQEVYNMAYSDYLKGNFVLAIDGFQIYVDNFPTSPFADNAMYWIGECYFSQKDHEMAIEQFNDLIITYPQSDRIPASYLKKGISLTEMGRKDEALAVYKLLISKFPLEEETKIAQQKIQELGTQQ
jgi:tol-pal system protein YbgF